MYKQFNKEMRIELAGFRRTGDSITVCAKKLEINYSTVWRELDRYSCYDGAYRGAKAHKRYLENRKKSKQDAKIIQSDKRLRKHIIYRLKISKWSPEQIAGRILVDKKYQPVSSVTIYQWIDENSQYKKYLKVLGTKGRYKRRKGTKARAIAREDAKITRIDERPEVIDNKERLGDFEGDTIIGSDKTKRILTHTERVSGYGWLDKLDIVTAPLVQQAIVNLFTSIPETKRHSCTYDNGSEFGKEDKHLESQMNMDIYRAFPYHSWERGCSENYNKLVREFFPKGTDFGTIDTQAIARVQKLINHRPRKRLGYLTPHEVFVLGMEVESYAVQGLM